jgi:hypothetical protein
MSEEPEGGLISRRKALSMLGLTGALGLVAPRILLAASEAEAQAVPSAFAQVDKPIPGEENVTQRRLPRRKRVNARRQNRHKRRPAPRPQPQQQPQSEPPPQTQPFTGYKPY